MPGDENGENEKIPQHIADIASLTGTQLKEKYPRAYSSWRNGKQRSKAGGNWSEAFESFRDFLTILGPPGPEQTLNRINNNNPMYAPGLVEWASPQEQANNRSTTRYVEHGGDILPLADAAREESRSPEALRQRLLRSAPTYNAFEDFIRSTESQNFDPRSYKPWPQSDDPGTPQRWEDWWLQHGGLKSGTNRYQFLINGLNDLKQKARRDMQVFLMHTGQLDDSRYVQLMRLFSKFEAALERAEVEYPQWLRAVRKFEALRAERKALKGNNYLNDDPGTDT